MKTLMMAAVLGLTTAVFAAPAPQAAPTAPPAPMTREQRQAQAQDLKKELGLTDTQATALRNENERFRGVLISARAEHRSNINKILTPEQVAKLEAKEKGKGKL